MSLLLAFILDDTGVGLTGQSVSTSIGAFSFEVVDIEAIYSQLLTSSVGQLTVETGVTVSGQSITSSAGSLTTTEVVNYNISGQFVSSFTGTPTVSAVRTISVNLIGIQALFTYGGFFVITTEQVDISGISITGGIGTLTTSIAGNEEANPSGVSSATSVGTLSVSSSSNVNVSIVGSASTSAGGTLPISISDNGLPNGQQIILSTNNPTVTIRLEPIVTLVGIESTSSSGTLGFINSYALVGISAEVNREPLVAHTNYVGYPITAATALTTVDSIYQSLGFSPSDVDRSYWPDQVGVTVLVPETSGGNATGRVLSGPATGAFTAFYYQISIPEYHEIHVTLVDGQVSNIFPQGRQIQTSVGNLNVLSDNAVIGQSIAVDIGSISVATSDTPTLTSVSAQTQQGSLTVQLAPGVFVSGQQTTSGQGIVRRPLDNEIVGQDLTSSLGTLEVQIADTVVLGGIELVSSRNSLSVSSGSSSELTGIGIVSSIGDVSFSDAKDNTISITSLGIASSNGTPSLAQSKIVNIPNILMQSAQGVIGTADRLVYLVGKEVTSSTKLELTVIDVEIKDWKTYHHVEYVFGNTNV